MTDARRRETGYDSQSEVTVDKESARLFFLVSSLWVAVTGCGGGSSDDAGLGGGGPADAGPGSIDQAPVRTDGLLPAPDQATPAVDQAVPPPDQGGGKLDGAVAPDLRPVDAPVAIDGPGGIDGLSPPDAPSQTDTTVNRDTAIPTDGPVVGVPALRVGPNGAMTVTFSNGTTSSGAWVGLYASSAADGAYLTYQYTGGVATGALTFTVPEATGTYNFRLFADGGYTKIATSADFAVSYPYDLDPGFATGGRLSFDFLGNDLVDGPCAVIPLAGGKVLLAGSAKTGSKNADGWEQNEFAVAQLNADGSFDATFGTGGKAHAAPSTTHALAGCTAAAVGGDGKIVIAGWGWAAGVGTDYVLARFTGAGVLDTTFGTAGFVTTNFKSTPTSTGENDKALSVAVLPDGRILAAGEMLYAAGSYNNGRPTLARYTSAGALDTTFGGTGMVALDFAATPPPGGQSVFDVNSLVVTATGAAYAGLTAVSSYGRNDMGIAGLKADGSLDASFGVAGVAWESKPGTHNNQYLTQIALGAGGSLLMLGHDSWAWFLGRYTAAGAPDTAFGASGQAVGDLSEGYDYPAGMVQLSDGPILIGFSPDSGDGASMSGNLGLARHEASGKVDGIFGKPRWKWVTTSGTLASRAASFAMQADGKLLLAGVVENPGGNRDFAVIRLVKQPGW